jgi:hypothetical protein
VKEKATKWIDGVLLDACEDTDTSPGAKYQLRKWLEKAFFAGADANEKVRKDIEDTCILCGYKHPGGTCYDS